MKTTSSMRWLDALTIALFAVALIVPAALLRPDPEAAAAEKRTLSPPPKLPRSWTDLNTFPRAFDAWFSDSFGLRQTLIKAHSRISFFVLRTSPSPKVFLGRDGFIFLRGNPEEDGDPIADFRGTAPLTPYELERWRWQLEDQHDWLRDQGITFIFAVIPGKERMSQSFLPPGYKNIGKPGAYEQFVHHIQPRATYPFVDLQPTMAAANEHQITFRKTDTHWNETGAWAGIFAITDTLRMLHPHVPYLAPSDLSYEIEDYDEGDMGNMIGLPRETHERLVTIRRTDTTVVTTPLTDHPLGDIITTTDDPSLPRAVLFHDSFGHYVKSLMGEYFSSLRFRWSNAGIDRSVVFETQPEIVIHLMAERRIRMGQRYEMAIQQRGNQLRFDRSSHVIARWDSENGFDQLKPVPGVTQTVDTDSLLLTPVTHKAGLFLPPIPEIKDFLPVVHIDCTVLEKDEVTITTRHDDSDRHAVTAKGPLPPGRHSVYLPLLDPEATGSPVMTFLRQRAPLKIHRIEVRLIPR